jgi:hypothetical protein
MTYKITKQNKLKKKKTKPKNTSVHCFNIAFTYIVKWRGKRNGRDFIT